MKKDKVIEFLDGLPDEFTIEELIQRMLFIEKVERRIVFKSLRKKISGYIIAS